MTGFKLRGIARGFGALFVAATLVAPAAAQGGDPIKIGFSLPLTGALAQNGKQALLGAKIWEEEINAKGGLLGRKVVLVNYDDQSDPANIPGIYAKLLDADKVDLLNGPYTASLVAPALSAARQRGKLLIGLLARDANSGVNYDRYFSMNPAGPKPNLAFTEGYFQAAAQQKPKPQTVALIAEDAEFGRNACAGARENAKTLGFEVTYDNTFPSDTTDFQSVVRALQTADADLVVACALQPSSVGIIAAASELNFTPKMLGGAMLGLQSLASKHELKNRLNGVVNYENWAPSPKLMPLAADFFEKFQERALRQGIDPLGYYLGGWGYAYFQLLGEAVQGAVTLDDGKLADYMHSRAFTTIMGADVKFGPSGEWAKSRILQVQYRDIPARDNLTTWSSMDSLTVLAPADERTGDLIYPYAKAK